jgi:hypothetical protein
MTNVAQVLGLIGGIGGTLMSGLILLAIWVRRVSGRARIGQTIATDISVWGLFVLIFAIVGIVGAALVKSKPRLGGILMLVSGGGGVLAIIIATIAAARVGGVDLIEGIFSLLLLTSGILGIASSSK